jgi:predicted hydrocarbon binding protein
MAEEKTKTLEEIRKEFNGKFKELLSLNTNQRIVYRLMKNLVRSTGHHVATTVLKREFRSLGREDGEKILEVFRIKENGVESAKKVLKIAAMMLGLNLTVVENVTVAEKCPYCGQYDRESFVCDLCREYCTGVVERVLGENYILVQSHKISEGQKYCRFDIEKLS